VALKLGWKVRQAKWITGQGDIKASGQDGTVELTIPVVNEYEVIVLE
jgi:hypothetical protein